MRPPKITKKSAVSNFKTRIKVVFIWILVIAGGYLLYFCWNMFPVISGYGAKTLCSCAYIQGRPEKEIIEQELGTLLGKIGSFALNPKDSSASGRVLFFAKKKAIFRKGLGCTLVNGLEEETLRAQKFQGKPAYAVNQDTIAWPNGNALPDSIPNGVNKEKLDALVAEQFADSASENPTGTRAIVVLYKGQIVAERYAHDFDRNTPQMGWSMTKSIINALTGILVKQGTLKVNEPAPIAAWAEDERKKITLNDLLHASSGLSWGEKYNSPSDATEMLFREYDAGGYALSQKKDVAPNQRFNYSSGTTNILSWIMRQKTGDGYHSLPYQRLFKRIGMHSAILEPDPSGTFVGSSFCYATARDWARFGLLYLNDGVWDGSHILPEGWVQYTATPAPAAPRGEYGAQWWLNAGAAGNPTNRTYPNVPTDSFQAEGFEGQFVFVVPSKNLVLVRLGLSQQTEPDMNAFVAEVIGLLQ